MAKTAAKLEIQRLPGGLKVIFPELPPSLNVYLRWHWARRYKYVGSLAEQLAWLAHLERLRPLERVEAKYTFYFQTDRIRDRDNLNVKVINDVLKKAKIIIDDNAKVITREEREIAVDRESPRVEVVLREVAKNGQ